MSVAYAKEEDLLRVYGNSDLVSLAIGYEQSSKDAPASVTVFTQQDIQRTGATSVMEALQWVDGVHIGNSRGLNPVVSIRGLGDGVNNQVLFLVNGLPLNDVVNSGPPLTWDYPLFHVSRIEIVRGPTSALHGAEAIAGVVNIITKAPEEIRGVEFGANAGRFDTKATWVLAGTIFEDWALSFGLQARSTDGHDAIIGADDQTRVDNMFGTNASLAPGSINLQRDDYVFHANAKYKDSWQLRIGYQKIDDAGTGVGIANALDPDGSIDTTLLTADANFRHSINPDVDVTATLSFLQHENGSSFALFPAGAADNQLPEGMLLDVDFTSTHIRGSFNTLYKGFDNHTLNVGMGFDDAKLRDIDTSKNFGLDLDGVLTPFPFFANVDVHGVPGFLDPQDRTLYYVYLQDEWRFAADWLFTAGIRYDNYSDIEDAVTPRASLVWHASQRSTVKLIYGEAFRPPSLVEMFSNTGGLFLGNRNLDPEKSRSLELRLDTRWSERFSTSIGAYRFEMDDLIVLGSDVPQSAASPIEFVQSGDADGEGVELSATFSVNDTFNLSAFVARQTFDDRDDAAYHAPQTLVSTKANWQFAPKWNLFAGVKWVSDRDRTYNDPRSTIADYTWSTLSLRRNEFAGMFDVSITINNVFDDDAREPTDSPLGIPGDIPLSERTYLLQVRASF